MKTGSLLVEHLRQSYEIPHIKPEVLEWSSGLEMGISLDLIKASSVYRGWSDQSIVRSGTWGKRLRSKLFSTVFRVEHLFQVFLRESSFLATYLTHAVIIIFIFLDVTSLLAFLMIIPFYCFEFYHIPWYILLLRDDS
jgi:hypothetical protein